MKRQTERPLTALQRDMLGVVAEAGPVTPRDVAGYHLLISQSSARSALEALEKRGLVGATYTGHHRGTGRAYEVTRRGSELVEVMDEAGDEA